MRYVKAAFKQAEKVKKQLFELEVFDKRYTILKDDGFVYFPVIKKVKNFTIVNKKAEKKSIKLTLEQILKGKLNKKELGLLTKAFDVIGDIAILEIEEELLSKKKIIADAILKVNKNVNTVVRKVGEHKGKYRIQDCEYLAGEKRFETLHKESGVSVKLDVRKVYFSPRLSNERLRVSSLVKPGEEVLVMFSGVGIYPFVIAKYGKAKEIYGVEINPVACKYADENIIINKAKNIKLFCGDVAKVGPKLNKKFDRIIMPLPKESTSFLDLAFKVLKRNGIIHLYCFSAEEGIQDIIELIKKKCNCEVISLVKCGQQSPRIWRYCIDFRFLEPIESFI